MPTPAAPPPEESRGRTHHPGHDSTPTRAADPLPAGADPTAPAALAAAGGAGRAGRGRRRQLLDLRTAGPGRPTRRPTSSAPAGRTEHVAGDRRPAARRRQRRPTTRSASTWSARCAGWAWRPRCRTPSAPEAGQLSGAAGGATLARVRNVVARLPGTAPTGRVFLVAHYDSVQTGPGGNDDAAGTVGHPGGGPRADHRPPAAQRRRLRAHRRRGGVPVRRGGVRRQHPLAADGGVVLNLEARGTTGPVIMFETSRNNAEAGGRLRPGRPAPGRHLVRGGDLPGAAQRHRLHRRSSTRSFIGLNSAYIDGGAIYHTPLDTPAAMDRGSLQQHGDNALGAGPGVRRRPT